jgi:hypothetical protein
MNVRPWLRCCSHLLAIGLAAGLAAQDPPAQRFLRFVDDATGLPLPGVEVMFGDGEPDEAHLVDGWLHRGPPRPPSAERHRSDPEGCVRYESRPGAERFVVLPPHALVAAFDVEGGREVRVLRAHDLTVQVVDADGRPVPDLALHCIGSHVPAWTDAHGLARFAALQPFPVGTRVVARSWLAPPDQQMHAEVCAGERVVRMVLPPHGTLRLRFLRHGEPATVNVFRLQLERPVEQALWGPPPALPEQLSALAHLLPPVACKGAVIGPMIFGGELRGVVQVGRLRVPFAVDSTKVRERELVVDVETDPPRPSVAARVRVPEGERLLSARLTAVTDVGAFRDDLKETIGRDGELASSFDDEPVRGAQLLRVHVDALLVRADGVVEGRTRTVDVARALQNECCDLADLELVPHGPVARGRVVDGRGNPIGKARLLVDGDGAPRHHQADATGPFVLPGPPLRGRDGELARGTLRASWSQPPPMLRGAAEVWAMADLPAAADAPLELVVPDPTLGTLAVELRGVPPAMQGLLSIEFRVGDRRFPMYRDANVVGVGAIRQMGRGLPIGRGELTVTWHGQRLLRRELDVPPSPNGFAEVPLEWNVDFAGVVRERRVRAVANDGAHLPKARLSLRGGGVSFGMLPDERGDLVWFEAIEAPLQAFVWCHGKQVVALAADTNGPVTLPDAAALRVVLHGLPLEAFDRPCQVVLLPAAEVLSLPMHGQLQPDGIVDLQGPPPGRYHLALYRDYAEQLVVAEIEVAADCSQQIASTLDDAARERLRALDRPKSQ